MLNPVQPLEYETGLFKAALSSTGLDSNLIYRLKLNGWRTIEQGCENTSGTRLQCVAWLSIAWPNMCLNFWSVQFRNTCPIFLIKNYRKIDQRSFTLHLSQYLHSPLKKTKRTGPSTAEQQQISAHDWNTLSNSNNFPIAHGHIKENSNCAGEETVWPSGLDPSPFRWCVQDSLR